MANTCMIYRHFAPATSYLVTDWQSQTPKWWQSGGKMIGNPAYFAQQAQQAISDGAPYYFDADSYNIKCVAFPSSGDTSSIFGLNQQLTTQATAIANLQTQATSLQQQVDALAGGSVTQAPNPEIVSSMAIIFGASLVAAAAIQGLKAVYNLFRTRDDQG